MFSLLSLFFLTSVVVTLVGGQTTVITNGASGVQCDAHKCLAGTPPAVCNNSECVCPDEEPRGKGSFACSSEDYELCMIFNDPQVIDFARRRGAFPMNCKTLATDLETTVCNSGVLQQSTTCSVRVLPFGGKLRGKTYVGGFEAEFWTTLLSVDIHIRFRIRGFFTGAAYQYTVESTRDEGANPTWGDEESFTFPGVGSIQSLVDNDNNFVGVDASLCGVTVGLRVVNPADRFLLPAGLFIKVDNRCEPKYLSQEHALCKSPDANVDLVQDAVDMWSNVTGLQITEEMIIFFNILRTPNIEAFDFPDAPPALVDVVVTAAGCTSTDLVIALYWCMVLTIPPHLVTCLDPSVIGNELMVLFNQCLQVFCSPGQTQACLNLQDQLTNCTQFFPPGDSINNFVCTSLP